MWLKNLCVFLGTEPFEWDVAQLDARLAEALCPECSAQSPSAQGFVPPVKGATAMVHTSDGLAICMHQETTRLLPGAVIAEEVGERIDSIENDQARKVGRREKADIRDQVQFDLLPRAFTRSRRTAVVIDLKDHRLWVDCAAEKRAEQIVARLRSALGSLPVARAAADRTPGHTMTAWLAEHGTLLPHGFEIGDRCLLQATDEARASVRIDAMDLQRDEVRAHLAGGMQVTRLNLCVDDAIEFDLDDNLDIKRIRALDLVQNDLDGLQADDAVSELQARLAIQGQVLRGMLDRIYTHFGVVGETGRAA